MHSVCLLFYISALSCIIASPVQFSQTGWSEDFTEFSDLQTDSTVLVAGRPRGTGWRGSKLRSNPPEILPPDYRGPTTEEIQKIIDAIREEYGNVQDINPDEITKLGPVDMAKVLILIGPAGVPLTGGALDTAIWNALPSILEIIQSAWPKKAGSLY